MKAKVSFLLLTLAAFCAGFAGTAGAVQDRSYGGASVQIIRMTGTIRIVTPENKIITVSRGGRLPAIPSGSKIMVLSGRAHLEAGNARLVLGENQALIISMDETTRSVRMAYAEGSIGIVRVRTESSIILLARGNTVSVTPDRKTHKQVIQAEQGALVVITPEGRKQLAEGGRIVMDVVIRQREDAPVLPEPPQPKIEEASPSVP